ncbi:hypothetical protein CK203_044095 [Vitis vinifera]|uniref:Uncharacterized protein n=1 Tax=Vitis vinifera TaxID=29760 RepID=A0A438HM73_VITVI|nr:hypothetical protein CK203_044095 [Vitis vinifera]
MTTNLEVQWGKKTKRQRYAYEAEENGDADRLACFSKRSILYNLEYWKCIPMCHNLDVMHIEKNVCEILIALMLNTKGKTKDDANARRDLKHFKIKEWLWLRKQMTRKFKYLHDIG